MKISREPALYLTLFATLVRLLAAFWLDLSDGQQAVLNATATAVAGLIVAVWVRRDGQVAALLGVVQAVLALAVGFGADLSAESQAVIMSFVGTAAAMFVRTQVDAKTPAVVHAD
ncbi:hypothetical protein FHR83_006731 [Actinoplanes campanulatus]|uniref:Uncharacterized protein n=1 Tax=Actinoplanes campanulatus TaxID=113559 RepID=A0A7W5FI23_9ACTN|nr:hypothetical protein [Actinoplanes campanulatus]MBB3099025.1 hypothetical protein [Actinoplanes campanulatus]GGN39377.1 hypothetical protein GCM10010109_67250 [Actinoplanes campanulatus]GID40184.1 hypothetical protein Aca09nite_66900 [Actinoplanes campanulatus]